MLSTAHCPFISLPLWCGGMSDRMGMRQDRMRRTCSLNMALAESHGHRETRMGTTDLGSVQLSKTRVKPTSCHWDSHNGVKPNIFYTVLYPLDYIVGSQFFFFLFFKVCTPMHLCFHTRVNAHTQRLADYTWLLHIFSKYEVVMEMWSGSIFRIRNSVCNRAWVNFVIIKTKTNNTSM